MASRVAVFTGSFRNVQGVEQIQRRLAQIPEAIRAQLRAAILAGADELAEKVRAIAPVAPEFERHPGEMRESVHRLPGDTELGAKVAVDAKDEHGEYYAAHVEYGHKLKDGGHVPAKPFFWPAYQVTKKSIRSRVTRATRAGVRAAIGS